jgi:hypothetical protein
MTQSVPLANPDNIHDAGNFGSDQGPVTGFYVTGNKNIQRGGKRRSRRRRRRRRRGKRSRRGGGYGFNPNGTPQYGRMPIETTNVCGVPKDPNLNTAIQHIGSPPPVSASLEKRVSAQKGGGKGSTVCGSRGGSPYYGYTAAGAEVVQDLRGSYPPVTAECHAQCGGRRRKRKTKKQRRRRRRRTRHRRRKKRGGYTQYGSNIPSTPGYATPNGGNWLTANPPTYARNDACGTGNCVDNYNHFTGKGFASPVFDADVNPLPPRTVIKTPNNTSLCGGHRRRRRKKRGKRKSKKKSKKKHVRHFRSAAGH